MDQNQSLSYPTAKPVKVKDDNYVHVESGMQMKGYIDVLDCFARFYH